MASFSSLIVVVLTFITTVDADECSTSELLTIASSTHLDGCTSDVGFGGFSSISALTDEQVKAVCGSSDCVELMDDMRAMDFGDCIIQGTNISLGKDILDPFERACSSSGSADSSFSSRGDGSGASGSNSAATRALLLSVGWVASIAFVLVSVL